MVYGDEISNLVQGSLWDTIEVENTFGWNESVGVKGDNKNS